MTFAIIDETHAPSVKCWIESANGHADFPIQNLPYGMFSMQSGAPRAGVAIGDWILDLLAAAATAMLPSAATHALHGTNLNALLAIPAEDQQALRKRLSHLLSDAKHKEVIKPCLRAASDCTMQLPVQIGDYTDFYAGIHHALNVGKQFRPDAPLHPNSKHIPIGYHGRASSIRPSGIPVRRPMGQSKSPTTDSPVVGPSARLDYELELGVWIGRGNALGQNIPIEHAVDHIAGFCLLNDWSARDLQAWEYVPLGPFLAKNFHSTISPWVITAEALAPFRIAQATRPDGDPQPLPYLWDSADQAQGALAVTLEAYITTNNMRAEGTAPHRLSRVSASNMYWTVQQLVAHHASNGRNLNPGDLMGTGTISAPTPDGYGSLLEITEGGKAPINLPNGEHRCYLEEGDELNLKATAHADGYVSIGFGECRATILPMR